MAANMPIPVYKTLEEIYPKTHIAQAERWNNLLEAYERVYKRKATVVCRAPGRVNLIGEHIDYSLFGVLPAAIESDILIACSARPDDAPEGELITAENMDERYELRSFSPSRHKPDHEDGGWDLGVDRKTGGWTNFVKAGFYGVLKGFLSEKGAPAPVSFDLLVTGSVPDGAGLSSSAAMVVASTLSFLTMNNCLDKVTQGDLVEMARDNERIVGVNSGGMDQAASVLTTPSSAIYITFFPKLSAEKVQVPKSARFVIANTLATHNLFNSGKIHYNLRVVESSLSALLLSLHLNLPTKLADTPRPSLRHVLEGLSPASSPSELEQGLRKLLPIAEDVLGYGGRAERGWTWEEIFARVKELGWEGDREQFESLYGEEWIEIEADYLHLMKRTHHVFKESLRVLEFRAAALDKSVDEAETLSKLGEIMNASHVSCRDEFDCSSPELNALVKICLANGALGSRLTGAGWGGSTISLLPAEVSIEQFVKGLSEGYEGYKGLSKEELNKAVLETRPGSGAGVYYV